MHLCVFVISSILLALFTRDQTFNNLNTLTILSETSPMPINWLVVFFMTTLLKHLMVKMRHSSAHTATYTLNLSIIQTASCELMVSCLKKYRVLHGVQWNCYQNQDTLSVKPPLSRDHEHSKFFCSVLFVCLSTSKTTVFAFHTEPFDNEHFLLTWYLSSLPFQIKLICHPHVCDSLNASVILRKWRTIMSSPK